MPRFILTITADVPWFTQKFILRDTVFKPLNSTQKPRQARESTHCSFAKTPESPHPLDHPNHSTPTKHQKMLHQIRNLIFLGCLAASVVAVTGGNDKVNCNDCAKRIKDCEKVCSFSNNLTVQRKSMLINDRNVMQSQTSRVCCPSAARLTACATPSC